MTTVSEVTICNQALGWLGQDPITSLNDNNTTASLCKANYAHLRDAVLEARAWTFASARHVSESADRDAFDQFFLHGIPTGWLVVRRCFRQVTESRALDSRGWSREGNKVLAKEATVYLWGTQRIDDPGQFTPAFVQALAARIAADLCVPLTENRQLQVDLWNLYERKVSEAAATDGGQGANEIIKSDSLVNIRASDGYGMFGDSYG
jgi:hypothetical protein